MDVAASGAPASERSAVASAPLQPVLIVLLVTSALCSLALLLARAFTWPAQGRPRAFEYLFLRNEPTAAWLSCAIILGAALAATGVRSLPDRMFVARLARDPRAFIACITAALIGALKDKDSNVREEVVDMRPTLPQSVLPRVFFSQASHILKVLICAPRPVRSRRAAIWARSCRGARSAGGGGECCVAGNAGLGVRCHVLLPLRE